MLICRISSTCRSMFADFGTVTWPLWSLRRHVGLPFCCGPRHGIKFRPHLFQMMIASWQTSLDMVASSRNGSASEKAHCAAGSSATTAGSITQLSPKRRLRHGIARFITHMESSRKGCGNPTERTPYSQLLSSGFPPESQTNGRNLPMEFRRKNHNLPTEKKILPLEFRRKTLLRERERERDM